MESDSTNRLENPPVEKFPLQGVGRKRLARDVNSYRRRAASRGKTLPGKIEGPSDTYQKMKGGKHSVRTKGDRVSASLEKDSRSGGVSPPNLDRKNNNESGERGLG